MPVETRWIIETKVCYQRVFDALTLEQLKQALDEAERMAAQGTPPVYFIIDVTELKTYPPLVSMLRVLRPTSYPNVSWSVLVVRHPLVEFMATMLTQLTGIRYHTVPTIQDALLFLASRDVHLPTITTF